MQFTSALILGAAALVAADNSWAHDNNGWSDNSWAMASASSSEMASPSSVWTTTMHSTFTKSMAVAAMSTWTTSCKSSSSSSFASAASSSYMHSAMKNATSTYSSAKLTPTTKASVTSTIVPVPSFTGAAVANAAGFGAAGFFAVLAML